MINIYPGLLNLSSIISVRPWRHQTGLSMGLQSWEVTSLRTPLSPSLLTPSSSSALLSPLLLISSSCLLCASVAAFFLILKLNFIGIYIKGFFS